MKWQEAVARMLGVLPPPSNSQQDDQDKRSEVYGGRLTPPVFTQTRWYLSDLEAAERQADQGQLRRPAQLCRAMRRDGVLRGVLSTRTGGLVRLPKKWRGHPQLIEKLRGTKGKRGIFQMLCPPTELALLAADGILLGVAVGELVPIPGTKIKVLCRLNPEFLVFRFDENQWYYNSVHGAEPITPGDGRWVLHLPGGVSEPWTNGLWVPLARSYIAKEHAYLHRENYSAKLANPARYARAPLGATEPQRKGFLERVIAWGINTVFELPPGWEVGLLESNGRGYEVFMQTIEKADNEIIVTIAGQTVTTDGGSAFSNAQIHKAIRDDLIKETAEGLAHTVNTQIIPVWVNDNYGFGAVEYAPTIEWDIAPPKDKKVEAEALNTAAQALEAMLAVLEKLEDPVKYEIALKQFFEKFDWPIFDIGADNDNDEANYPLFDELLDEDARFAEAA